MTGLTPWQRNNENDVLVSARPTHSINLAAQKCFRIAVTAVTENFLELKMKFVMKVAFLGFLIPILVYGVDQDARVPLGSFLRKPTGPFYCEAQCVALCLETKLAENVSACVEQFCSYFNEDAPCVSGLDLHRGQGTTMHFLKPLGAFNFPPGISNIP